ncbi:MAG: hypothetical protein P3A28_03015 [Gemmatimonadota bacterium]|nr:hypothetical protein [Gemmatimonadota bacterium]
MILPTAAQRLTWIAQWRSAAVALERIRVDELREVDLARVATDLEDACLASAAASEASRHSGLVEQQAALHRRGVG